MQRNFVRLSTMPRRKKSNVLEMFPNFKADTSRVPYYDARRHYYPIYQILIQEMYEANCCIAAGIFECLIRHERKIADSKNLAIFVRDNREVLLTLHHWAIGAEKAAAFGTESGLIDSLRMLENMILLLNEYIEYDWLLLKILTIAVKTCQAHDKLKKHNPNYTCVELKAKIYCLEAIYLAKHRTTIHDSLNYYAKALDLCRGELWTAPDRLLKSGEGQTLHEFVATSYAQTLMTYVKSLDYRHLEYELELSHQAVMVVSEVNTANNMELLFMAYLRKIKILIFMLRYHKAMVCINTIEPHLKKQRKTLEYGTLACQLLILKAKCLMYLKRYHDADLKLKQALHLSRQNELTMVEPKILFAMGQFYLNQLKDIKNGRKKLEEALYTYARNGDMKGHQKSLYALAKMKADQILPDLKQLIRRSNEFGPLNSLCKWKNSCAPFWSEDSRMDSLFARSDYSIAYQMSLRSSSDDVSMSSEEDVIDSETKIGYVDFAKQRKSH